MSIAFLFFLLAGCTPAAENTTTRTSTPHDPTPTATSQPTATATPTPTAIPTATPTPAPTSTPGPTACGEQHGAVARMHAFSSAMGRDERWRVYTPPCYAQQLNRRYPVLYLLHGGEHNDEHWDDIGIDTAADALIASGDIPPLLIVLPDGGQDFGPLGGDPPPFAQFMQSTLIPQIDRDERTIADRDHRRLGGISYGAAWALLLAARFPELWSAVGAHSPAIGSFNGIYPDAAALARGHVRAYLDVGDHDGLRKPTETFASQLQQAGADFELHIFAGRHTDAYWRAHLADYLHFYTAGW